LVIYNTTIQCVEYWNGAKWISLCESTSNIWLAGNIDCGEPYLTDTPVAEPIMYPSNAEQKCFTPVEEPGCTVNPPFTTTLIVGIGYATLSIVDPATGKFQLMFTSSNPTPTPRTAIVRVVSACTGNFKDFVFIQAGNPCTALANPTLAATPAAICAGAPATLTATPAGATQYQWYYNGAPIGVSSDNTRNITDAGQYSVRYRIGECWSEISAPITLLNSKIPQLSLVGDWPISPICLGKTMQEVKCIPNDVTYTWSSENSALIGVTPLGIGNIAEINAKQGTVNLLPPNTWYKVVAENACGTDQLQFIVSISCIPCDPMPTKNVPQWCEGDGAKDVGFSAPVPGVTSYLWVIPANWTYFGSTTNYQLALWPGTNGVATLTMTYACGDPVVVNFPLIVRRPNTCGGGVLSGPHEVCADGGPYTYTLTQCDGSEYVAGFPSGWVTSVSTNSEGNLTTYIVNPTGPTACEPICVGGWDGCEPKLNLKRYCEEPASCAFKVYVSAGKPSTPTGFSGPTCVNNILHTSTLTYSVTNIPDAIFDWTLPPGWTIVSGDGTNSITVKASGTITNNVTLLVRAYNICGTSAQATRNIFYQYIPEPVWAPTNLGADPSIDNPKKQIQYTALHQTGVLDGRVYGGLYQWGRDNKGDYAINPVTYERYQGNGLLNKSYSLITGLIYNSTTGQILATPTGDDLTKVHVYAPNPPFTGTSLDWRIYEGQRDDLWGSGIKNNVPTNSLPEPGIKVSDGNYYQGTTWAYPQNNPCPLGWRVPVLDEWKRLLNYTCDNTAFSAFSTLTFLNNQLWETTNTGYVWVLVNDGKPHPYLNPPLTLGDRGGYAIYKIEDWNAAIAPDGYFNGLLIDGSNVATICAGKYLYDAGAPMPYLFLPLPGSRSGFGGNIQDYSYNGTYWTASTGGSSPLQDNYSSVLQLRANNSTNVMSGFNDCRASGNPIRCVKSY
jgi:hypothetical protein